MTTILPAKTRLQWVDAMRGFSMILVVLGHALQAMGIGGYDSFLNSLLLTFRMPLFFFVSGFFSFKAIEWWNKERVSDILSRKIKAQILATALFLFLYLYSKGESFDGTPLGYWFTIVLFQMYVIYLVLSIISKSIHKNIVIPGLVLLSAVGIGIVAICKGNGTLWNLLSWDNLCRYLQFFTLGIAISKYRNKFFEIAGSNIFTTITIVGWTICMVLWYSDTFKSFSSLAYSFVHDIIVRYFGLLTVITVFFQNSTYFSKDTSSARMFRYIGQRTLDIYFLHFFFLPDLKGMCSWISRPDMIIIQIGLSLALTALIVGVCLLISSVLRESSTLRSYLFGAR